MADIFEQLDTVCPVVEGYTSDVITVVIDERHQLGKKFKLMPDGTVEKKSAVAVARGIACQYSVPDFATLENVLRVVSDNPHAAITNAGWKHVAIGERFLFLSKAQLIDMGLEPEAITTVADMTALARLKDHATPSTWQLFDRDEDKSTPDWAVQQSFNEWRLNLDKILPGVAAVEMLRAQSSSARVLRADGTAVGGGNGHVWIKITDPGDAERTRSAILARAIELDLAWTKPRLSNRSGLECGRGWATIVDWSVWTTGRLVFVGQPTCLAGLTITEQQFEHIKGDSDALDTSKAVVSVLKTFRASSRLGVALRLSRNGTGFSSVMHDLRLDTEIEVEDGNVKTVRDLMLNFTDKVRCQTPFRESNSTAAFMAIDGSGEPFIFDSGTNTKHVLARPVASRTTDKDRERLISEVRFRLGNLVGDENVAGVFDEAAMRTAWDATVCTPNNNKVVVLNRNDEIVDLSGQDATCFGLRRSFGHVFHGDLLDEVIAEKELLPKEEAELRKTLTWLQYGPFMEFLKLFKQAKSADISVDMFTKRGRMRVADGIATIVLPHRRFVAGSTTDMCVVNQVVEDYILHFPEFRVFLDLVLHARFATDRRHAFVWLHSPSSWGKGFLVAILAQLALVVEASAAEIEKAMAGAPVGLSLVDTLRSWILFVDEFKAASSELKLLNTRMSIAPKNQLRCTVQLYTKLFASAENVRSLVGDGVEAQFNNRFAYLSPSTHDQKLEDRILFMALGKATYIGALVSYVASYLNDGVDRLRLLGPVASSKVADTYIEAYQSERRLQTTFGSLDDAVDDVVEAIRDCLIEYARWSDSGGNSYDVPDVVEGIGPRLQQTLKRTAVIGNVSEGENGKSRYKAIVLSDPVPFIKSYLGLSEDRSIIGKMSYKADLIAAKLHMRTEPYSEQVRIYEHQDKQGLTIAKAKKRGVVVFISKRPDLLKPCEPIAEEIEYEF